MLPVQEYAHVPAGIGCSGIEFRKTDIAASHCIPTTCHESIGSAKCPKYARRDSNPQPSVPKTDALSSCATDAKYSITFYPDNVLLQAHYYRIVAVLTDSPVTACATLESQPCCDPKIAAIRITAETHLRVFRLDRLHTAAEGVRNRQR